MRNLTDKEKDFIKKIIKLKKDGNLDELQSAKLLRKQLDCLAIIWNVSPKKEIQIYYERQKNDTPSELFVIVDYLNLIEELLQYKLITILDFTDTIADNEERKLYDRVKYKYNKDEKCDIPNKMKPFLNAKDPEDFFYGKEGHRLFPCRKEYFYINVIDALENYAHKIIYPLPLLEDLCEHDFKSIEQRNLDIQLNEADKHHNEQIKEARNATKKALLACIISLVSVVVTFVLGVIQCCSDTKLDTQQYEQIIEVLNHDNHSKTYNRNIDRNQRIKNQNKIIHGKRIIR